jgi:hypothetical protein
LALEFRYAPEYLKAMAAAVPSRGGQVTPEVSRLLAAFTGEHSRREVQEKLGLQDDDHMRLAYVLAALAAGLIEMTIPAKPNSRLQKYRLTEKGREWLG